MSFDRKDFLKTVGLLTTGSLMPFNSLKPFKRLYQGEDVSIRIDFSKETGKIKALNGKVNGPYNFGNKSSAPIDVFYKEADFPYTRLHDVGWPLGGAVNIHAIFPFFDFDADDPRNYKFDISDDYIAPIIKNKSEIIYRLGENSEHKENYNTHPPKDFVKWAKICVNIIRHYNDGWNNGFHYGIKYWEVWNEPGSENSWTGTSEQYYKLYEIASKAIKKYDPSMKVGGPAAMSPDNSFAKGFLTYCRDNSLPLDFFSWHSYDDHPESVVNNAQTACKNLDKYGFTETKSILDEWHYMNVAWDALRPGSNFSNSSNLRAAYIKTKEFTEEMNGYKGASYAASVLILLQDAPIDITTYYLADYSDRWSMFNNYGIPGKVYYVFKAFNKLARLSMRISSTAISSDKTVYTLAALSKDNDKAAILISNFSPAYRTCNLSLNNFRIQGNLTMKIYAIDASRNLDLVSNNTYYTEDNVKIKMTPHLVFLIKIKKSS